ncbi:tripartite tricarboxylate transporter substrate binding protein [Rhodovarius crocodyli]|nr:tripartite tricarboxylate transporter substrate binding protein [Rhodovarius crocodyli]
MMSPQAEAQTRARGTVRLLVPYAPGGVTDVLSRLVAPHLAEGLGQPVVVENRPGGNSVIGTEAVARAAPDGLTIGMIDLAFLVNPSLMQLPYDTQRDFAPIALVATAPLVMMINPRTPVRTADELRAYVRARPGQFSYASAGVGTAVHVAGEQLAIALGTPLLHVSYRGGALPINAVVGGEVNSAFIAYIQARPLMETGQVIGLAITGAQRTPSMPNVPTFAELGLNGVDAGTINGLVAPAGTPREIVDRMATLVSEALRRPDMRARMAEVCCDPAESSPEHFRGWIGTELAKWAELVRAANIRLE